MVKKNETPGGLVPVTPTGPDFLANVDMSQFAIPLGETRQVELSMAWLKPHAGSVAAFVPLKRSNDVQADFPPKPGQKPKPKFVWGAQLLGPAVLLKDSQEIQGNNGDLFFFFEPPHPAIRNNLMTAYANGYGVVLINKGKLPTYSRELGTETLMWQYDLRLYTQRVETKIKMSDVAVPGSVELAKLPAAVAEAEGAAK